MCPGVVGSCSIGVENRASLDAPHAPGAIGYHVAPPSVLRLTWEAYVYSSMMFLLLLGSIVLQSASPPKISDSCPLGAVFISPLSCSPETIVPSLAISAS